MAVLTKTQFDAKVVALQAAITALLTSAPGARAISGADQRSVAGDIREILGDASDSMPFLPNVASWSNGMAAPLAGQRAMDTCSSMPRMCCRPYG